MQTARERDGDDSNSVRRRKTYLLELADLELGPVFVYKTQTHHVGVAVPPSLSMSAHEAPACRDPVSRLAPNVQEPRV